MPPRRWEPVAAIACAALCAVPLARAPAAFVLICLLPGTAIVRHRLGETSLARALVLGGVVSIAAVCAIAIPAALLLGRPTALLAVLVALGITLVASLRPVAPAPAATPAGIGWFAAICVAALVMQIGMSIAIHPDANTVRWRGLPDMIFFQGIYQQLSLATPPMDPENGSRLLVHNWIYHFHFALLHLAGGVPVPVMMRVISAWTAITLLGLVWLLAVDVLRRPAVGVLACAFLMTSGEGYWLLRSLARGGFDPAPLPWVHTPFGVVLLFGWYNLPPLAAGLAAWYWFARHRASGRGVDLAASVAMCAVMAFFHPVFYGVFMTAFCLWLLMLGMREGLHPAWLSYLATPLPFFLFYKLPYYGMAMPPRVIHGGLTPSGIADRAEDLALWGMTVFALGAVGLIAMRGGGPLCWLVAVPLGLRLLTVTPNPHWTSDPMYIALALLSGAGVVWLWQRWRRAAAVAASAALVTGGVAFAMHARAALDLRHEYTEHDRAAAAWLAAGTDHDDLVAVFPNSPSSYTVIGLAARRLAHGWTTHQQDFHPEAQIWAQEIAEMFATDDAARAAAIAARHGIDYVYVGAYEAERAGMDGLSGPCFTETFREGPIRILEYTCGAVASG